MDSSPDRPSGEEPTKSASDAPEAADASAPDTATASAAAEAPAAAEEPAAHDAADQPPRREPRRGSWLGFAAAIVGLLLAGFGVASFLMSRDNGVSALDARLAGVELGLRDLSSRAPSAAADPKTLEDMTNRVAKLEADAKAAPQPAASDAALAARMAALETELKTLADSVRGLNRRDEEALAAAREARVRADAGAAEVAELAQKIPGAGAAERSELEALTNRMAALERSAKAVESSNGALRLALAATMLDSAVERGDAFGPWLAAIKAFGTGDAKLVAALEPFAATGVPSAATLARQFSELAPALQKAGAPSGEGVLARLQVNAEKLIRIRRVDEPAGSDAGAIVARAEAKVSRGDVAGAASELAQLPPDVRAPAEAWIKRVQARSAAIDASHHLAADAMSGLSK
jgi:hypothetical protein